MQFVLLLILLMFIVRFVANSKLRAEAKAAVAIEAADHATLKQQLAEARLQALQAQVEPHFLFNTLAAVEHLIETDPPRAAKMQGNLIGYLRSVMPNLRKPDSTVGREVETCRHYLEILKVRMEDRLEVVIDVPPGLESASLPPLILQSLVENAIQHGLEPKAEGGQIKIKVEIADGHLVVIVADTGVGFTPKSSTSGGGLGLTNIRERLTAMFDKRGQLIITPNTPCGTQVRIELPYSVSDFPATKI
ncbi:MAG: histidine kinase [Rhodocyclaceae bacterium]|nr:histidine kinase [Rhodocyclaceae bacterium]